MMLIAVILGLALQTIGGTPDVGFQKFRLGQTIADAKAVELPDSISLVCSDDERDPYDFVPFAKPTEDEAGLIRCASSSPVPVTPAVSAIVSLDFVDGTLANISTEYPSSATDVIEAALVARYGKPAEQRIKKAQTGAGVTIDQKIDVWRIGTDTIELYSPGLRVDRMSVLYDSAAADAFRRRVKTRAAAGADL